METVENKASKSLNQKSVEVDWIFKSYGRGKFSENLRNVIDVEMKAELEESSSSDPNSFPIF